MAILGTETETGDLGDNNHHPQAPSDEPNELREDQPLLGDHECAKWKAPRGFVWIQVALMSNVFLNAFDGTITAATYAVISSEFNAANTASWLTTSYLITSTALLPLYGRVSDIFGRRICFFVSTITFAIGCLGCGLAGDIITLNIMRALTGLGGGGLMTMATIVNSDMIPFRKRGIYQAMQNGIFGLGAICGASLGGSIADKIGWRWCFLLQVPVSVFALAVGVLAVKNQAGGFLFAGEGFGAAWKRVDFFGALVLVFAISTQLLGLSLGGNKFPWTSPWVIGALIGSILLFAAFFVIEAKTSAIPIIPLRMLRGRLPVATQIANVCAGLAAYGFLFMLPLFFQVVLLESATKAGTRLIIPSLATPTGSLAAGIIMSRWGRLVGLIRSGAILMALGNGLLCSLGFTDSMWKYFVYIFPANLGQGIIYPSILFTSLASFDHEVWGVSITSAIVQTTLSFRLPDSLGDIPDKWRIVDEIRHSVDIIHKLPSHTQLQVRLVYYDGLRYAFAASTAAAVTAVIASFVASATRLRSTH
ncbi:MFS general substrate transporter [Xylona heveae TC161]|uniref:MFS general substrate transporter n=1 Tax=Xylona heveae (strain CBS 132557 / TC161) TaxID=1328760 RepID=A0A165IF85_XYLHT|nr:MFS general substrate transporter [Xylona heveae TC161]KZF24814.1 MFS general substrate transporter [Xylona heveae TC161]